MERVLERIQVDADGCWIWQGATAGGYGQVMTGSRTDGTRRQRPTHVVVWESQNGPVPDDMELDHLCRKRLCCNPSCLEAVTHSINVARGWQAAPGTGDARTLAARQARGLV